MTDKCQDKRLADMLYAYELDLLSADEQKEVEVHLLQCDQCFAKAERFLDASRLIGSDPEVRKAVLEQEAESPAQAEPIRSRGLLERLRSWATPRLVPTTVVAGLILLIIVLKPWRLEFHPGDMAIAAEDRIAVVYFQNMAEADDPDRLGEIIANLLITDLSESRFVQVVSSQRIHDVLSSIGRSDRQGLDQSVATEVAAGTGAAWMLTGSVIQVEPALVLTYQLVEMASGNTIGSKRIGGDSSKTIFDLVDDMTVSIKEDLDLPVTIGLDGDRAIADITTESPDAYRFYVEGLDYLSKLYWAEAQSSFERALVLDSTFAMSYYHLAELKDRSLIDKAIKFSPNASLREQLYIKSQKARFDRDTGRYVSLLEAIAQQYPDDKTVYLRLGSHERRLGSAEGLQKALGHLQRALVIDPQYKDVYNELAYVYDAMGDFEMAMETIDKYLNLAPDEANPYDTRAEIYAKNGQLDLAIESYNRALEIKPDFRGVALRLANMHIFKREYNRSEALYTVPRGFPPTIEYYREKLDRSAILIHQGKLNEAIAFLNNILAESPQIDSASASEIELRAYVHSRLARLLEEIDLGRAVSHTERAIELIDLAYPDKPIYRRPIYARLLTASGDISGALRTVEGLRTQSDASGENLYMYWFGAGSVEFYRGNYRESLAFLEKAVQSDSPLKDFADYFLLARTYQELGRLPEAIDMFEQRMAIYTPDRFEEGIWNVKMHYYLGLAYEDNGQPKEAMTQYEEFLTIWQNADSSLTAVDDARSRLARLKQQP